MVAHDGNCAAFLGCWNGNGSGTIGAGSYVGCIVESRSEYLDPAISRDPSSIGYPGTLKGRISCLPDMINVERWVDAIALLHLPTSPSSPH